MCDEAGAQVAPFLPKPRTAQPCCERGNCVSASQPLRYAEACAIDRLVPSESERLGAALRGSAVVSSEVPKVDSN